MRSNPCSRWLMSPLLASGLAGCLGLPSCSADDREMRLAGPSRPAAVNSVVDVFAEDLCQGSKANLLCSTEHAVRIRSISSSNTAVADPSTSALPLEGATIALETLTNGQTTLTVEAEFDDGSIRSASTELAVETPDSVTLETSCIPVTDHEPPAQPYLVTVGTKLTVGFELAFQGAALDAGRGIPLALDPSDLFGIPDGRDQSGRIELVARATPGPGTITLDAGPGATHAYALVPASAIDAIDLLQDQAGALPVSSARSIYIVPMSQGRRGCRLEAMYDVTVLTPEICRLGSGEHPTKTSTDWHFALEGARAGTCTARVVSTISAVEGTVELMVE